MSSKTCLACENRSRLINEDSSGYELWCEAHSEVVAEANESEKLRQVACDCPDFEKQE